MQPVDEAQGQPPHGTLPTGRKLAKETFWGAATRGSSLVLFIGTNAIIARSLGPADYGRWSLFLSGFNFLFLVSGLGIWATVKVFVARAIEAGNLRNVLRAGFTLRWISTAVCAVVLYVTAAELATVMRRPEIAVLFRIGALLLVVQGLLEFFKACFEGLHRIRFNFVINILEFGGKAAAAGALWVFGGDSRDLAVGFVLASLVATAAGAWMLHQGFYRGGSERVGESAFRPMIVYSVPLLVVWTGISLSVELDTLLLGYLSNNVEVATYAAAKQIAGKLPHVAAVIGLGMLPPFARLDDAAKPYLRTLFRRVLLYTGGTYAVVCVVTWTLSTPAMAALYGSEFVSSARVLDALLLYVFCAGLATVLGAVLDYRGFALWRAAALGGSIVVNVALSLLWIPRYGALGAAAAMSLSHVPLLVALWIGASRTL